MANTFELIQAYTVGSGGQASIDFTVIPSTYTDLCLKLSVRSTDDYLTISFNNSSSNLSSRTLGANSSGAFTTSAITGLTYGLSNSNSWTSNTFSNAEIYIPNYTSSTNKSYSVDAVTENNGTAITLGLTAGLWSNTAAINRITLTQASNNLLQYSTAYLYGVKNA